MVNIVTRSKAPSPLLYSELEPANLVVSPLCYGRVRQNFVAVLTKPPNDVDVSFTQAGVLKTTVLVVRKRVYRVLMLLIETSW